MKPSSTITHKYTKQHFIVCECVCGLFHSLTSDRWEVDADQQCEEGGDIVHNIGQVDIRGWVTCSNR